MLRTVKGPFVLRCIAASGRAGERERTTWARSRFDGGNAMAINKRSVTALCLLLLLLTELAGSLTSRSTCVRPLCATYSIPRARGARSSKPALAHFQRCPISRCRRRPLAAFAHLSKGTQHLTAVVAVVKPKSRAHKPSQAKMIYSAIGTYC